MDTKSLNHRLAQVADRTQASRAQLARSLQLPLLAATVPISWFFVPWGLVPMAVLILRALVLRKPIPWALVLGIFGLWCVTMMLHYAVVN